MRLKTLSLNQWLKALVITSLLFFCPTVFAAIFDVAPQDKSKEYLGIIFGGNIGTINLGGSANPMLGKMFERFNFIIVTIGTVIVSYIGILSVINTAREGEAMGKKFTTWMILRAVFGLLFMIPTPGTGYSVIQVMVAWIVLNGIGAANSVWEVVVTQLGSGIQAVGKVNIEADPQNTLDFKLKPLANKVFLASTCMQSLNSMPSFVQKNGVVKINVVRNPSTSKSLTATLSLGTDKYSSLCGSFTVTTLSNLPEYLSIKINALQAMFDAASPAAQLFTAGSCNSPECPSPGYTNAQLEAYKVQATRLMMGASGGMAKALAAYELGITPENMDKAADTLAFIPGFKEKIQKIVGEKVKSAADRIKDMTNIGWIHAGGYYYLLSLKGTDSPEMIAQREDIGTVPTSTYAPPIPVKVNTGVPIPIEWSTDLKNSLSTAPIQEATVLNTALGKAATYISDEMLVKTLTLPGFTTGQSSSGNEIIDKIFVNPINELQSIIITKFTKALTGETGSDPLASIGKFGSYLMITAELVPIAALVAGALLCLLAFVDPFVSTATMIVNQVVLAISGLCALFWALGATLGVYIPMVPYVIFLTTAFGWMLAVVEAIVGAPILALGMVHPSQDELGKVAPGLAILANIFLRPTLMIFGFILASTLVRAGLEMLNFSFLSVLQGSVPIPSIFSIIAILGLYLGLVLAIVNQSFTLIYDLPNKIFRWMGGAPEQHPGAEKMTGEAKGQFEGAAKQGESAVIEPMQKASAATNAEMFKKANEMREMRKDQGSISSKSSDTPPPAQGE